jgi:hypothetical protein
MVVVELLAILSAALFTGAAVYINLVEHPARMSLGTRAALAAWAPSYHRATFMQAPLAIVGGLSAFIVAARGGGAWWLAGGLLFVAVIPFTLLVIFPTNRALLDPATSADLDRAGLLLRRWNWLHAVRSLLAGAALVIFVAQRS